MRLALCTTTIHIPHALKLMRKCSSDVKFFVAGDEKTPHDEVFALLKEHCHPSAYIDKVATPYELASGEIAASYKCSEAIGWNTLARRNIAFLEALKWGADVIYSWDTDNIPMSMTHFDTIEKILTQPFNGILGSSKDGWFDAGQMLNPWMRHRGIPYNNSPLHHYDIATNFRAGIAAGLVIGNPDVDATLRMEKAPEIHTISKLGEMGVLVDANTRTVFNTQNVALVRDLVPAWFCMPGVGRYDDLYASLVVQRVARERGLHVHFGQPLVWQERHQHDQLVDLRAEIGGMSNIRALADLLDSILLPGKSVIEDTRIIYKTLEHCDFLPDEAIYAAHKWLDDCEEVI